MEMVSQYTYWKVRKSDCFDGLSSMKFGNKTSFNSNIDLHHAVATVYVVVPGK
jgi:hypothetical protein